MTATASTPRDQDLSGAPADTGPTAVLAVAFMEDHFGEPIL
ncbi:hypothetical protein ACH4TX_45645 [Streptomyces sp. NPDC021098]